MSAFLKRIAWVGALVAIGLGGCDRAPDPGSGNVMLTFAEQEHGSEPFVSRTLVTPDFLRMDGDADSGFILFDRRTQTIYSVNDMNGNILVITPQAVEAEPGFDLNLTQEALAVGDALPQAVAGRDAQRHRYSANGEVCLDVVTVPDLYEDAVKAMGEFLTVLAGQHGASLAMVPHDMRQPCDMATHIFAPTRHLQHGLPVWESAEGGAMRRYLTAHQPNWQPEEGLFTLPENYERYSLGGG